MAETTKLSVGKALEKLQGNETPKSRITKLDEKISALEKETQRMRAERLRVGRNQRAGLKETIQELLAAFHRRCGEMRTNSAEAPRRVRVLVAALV